MSIDPKKTQLPRVEDLSKYPEELFGSVPPLEGAPSFYDFLENVRGIPRTTFSPAAWEIISLTNEMVAYNMLLRAMAEQQAFIAEKARREKAKGDQLGGLPLDDLMMTRNMMQAEIDRVDAMISSAAAAAAQ